MKLADKITKILQERYSLPKKETLSENVKLFKTKPETDGGYWILITSNQTNSFLRDKETANMGWELKLMKGNDKKSGVPYETLFRRKFEFQRPEYYKSASGIFGWGYKIPPMINQERYNSLVQNLKTLVHAYNDIKKQEFDLETQNLTPEQIKVIGQIIDAVETSRDAAAQEGGGNGKIVVDLDKYLQDLQDAVEKDEVYEFLIDSFEKTKNFQRKNLSFHEYSFLNSLVIRFADPHATYAAPANIWKTKGYKPKDEYGRGIPIQKMGFKNSTWENARWFKDHETEWKDFKDYARLPENMKIDDYLAGGVGNAYSLASYGLKRKLFPVQSNFTVSYTFTDTMVEPIPGAEQIPLDSDEFQVKEEPIESMEMKNKIDILFDAVSKIADKQQVNILGVKRADGDINHLNNLLNKVLSKIITDKYNFMIDKGPKVRENEEILRAYAEVVSHIIKRHYKLPTESSKYNIASMGVDKDKMKQRSEAILNLANKFIQEIDMEIEKMKSVNESVEVKEKPEIITAPAPEKVKTPAPLQNPERELIPDKWKKNQPGPKPKAEAEEKLQEFRKVIRKIILEDLKA
jgi:hypothetical protein